MKIFLIVFTFALIANAQDSLKLSRIVSPPQIDGVLSEGEWQNATKNELFHQKEPRENDKPTESTEVFLAFDKENFAVMWSK